MVKKGTKPKRTLGPCHRGHYTKTYKKAARKKKVKVNYKKMAGVAEARKRKTKANTGSVLANMASRHGGKFDSAAFKKATSAVSGKLLSGEQLRAIERKRRGIKTPAKKSRPAKKKKRRIALTFLGR